ncbi:MAG: hypothetical protein RSA91_01025 [Bacilli bacterium]
MDKFIYCFDERIKQQLLEKGFKLMGTESKNGKRIYLFSNQNEIKLTNNNIISTNKLYF